MTLTSASIAALGLTIEFIGFVVLAAELIQTNKRLIASLSARANHKVAAATMTVTDGSDGEPKGLSFAGGALGDMIEGIQPQ